MKHRLFVRKLTSVGLVDAGDNPTADVLIFKTADTDLLPDDWNASKIDETRRVTAPDQKGATVDLDKIPADARDEVAALQKDRDAQADTVTKLEGQVAELQAQLDELTAPPDPDPLEKADPVVKAQLEAQSVKIAELEKAAADRDAAARLEKAQAVHTDLMLSEATAEDIAQVAGVAPEAWDRIHKDMVRQNAVIEQSDLLKELGRTGDGEPESAVAQVTHRANELRKGKPELTLAQAKVQVRDDDPDLKAAEIKETRGS